MVRRLALQAPAVSHDTGVERARHGLAQCRRERRRFGEQVGRAKKQIARTMELLQNIEIELERFHRR
jgi:hypothetical protein